MGHISGFGSLSLECDLMWPLRTRLVPLLASFISKLKPGHSETEVRGTSLQSSEGPASVSAGAEIAASKPDFRQPASPEVSES